MPGFRLIEEREAADLLNRAIRTTIQSAAAEKSAPLYAALHTISTTITEDQFNTLIRSIASERGQFTKTLETHFGIDGYYTELCKTLGVPPTKTPEEILSEACTDAAFNFESLKNAAQILGASKGKKDQTSADKISAWLFATPKDRAQNFAAYRAAFLTQKNTLLQNFPSKAVGEEHPHIIKTIEDEAARILKTEDAIKAAHSAAFSRDLFRMGEAVLATYAKLKQTHNVLDFEDLIHKTLSLLKTQSGWVQFKLDEGLDHILIDEAQDTNPEQWQIVEALCAEFFPAHSAPENNRTVFTVGDEKQSIYSFQRASPEEFARMQDHFADKIRMAQQTWSKVDLNISFRSTKSVLESVDATFADPAASKGLGLNPISHHSFRIGQAGHVELWPLFENDEDPKTRTWDPPIEVKDHKSGATKLADEIAKTIRRWLDNNETLPSHNRSIQPGDIIILVRTRNAFTHQLIRALKLQKIPVGGLDRMILNTQLAVQDLIAAANATLLPTDDLTLACLLKSPLIGMDEDTLFEIAHNREGTLIDTLHSKHEKIAAYLSMLERESVRLSPFEFFAHILQTPCPADPQSGLRAIKKRLGIDALDAIDELLNAALTYERDHIKSLQGFLHWQAKGEADIKRETSSAGNAVRIMTVHGSKGLQAPIVFLPDTTTKAGLSAAKADSRLLWPSASGLTLPIWSPRKDFEPTLYTEGKETLLSRLDQEYRRLLYVAMTRAEDRLYITGYKAKTEPHDMCWYNLVERGLRSHPEHEESEEGILTLYNPQTRDPDRTPKTQSAESQTPKETPAWLTRPAPQEPHPPAPLVPSRPAESEPAALSPLKAEDNARFRRGNLTHTLLQFLPDLPQETRERAAKDYLARQGKDLSETIRYSILTETLAVLNHPEFAAIFGPNSRAEVPITGLLPDGRLISGQIDRLLVTPGEIYIIDYKTNRPPPTDPADIPAIYRRQIKAYADTLRAIYPDRTIKAALLWTDGPNLMPLDPNTC